MKIAIKNACSIVSMRELLEDPTWGPEEYCMMVQKDGGLLGEKTVLLEQYAPVKVWFGGGLSGDDDTAEIYSGTERQSLSPEEKIIISYETGKKTAHMECIRVKDLVKYQDKHIAGIITRR